MRSRLAIAGLAIPLALLSACGGDDGGDASEPGATTGSDSSASPSAEPSETAGSPVPTEPTEPTEATETADPSAGWPDCGQVWADGARLPRGYEGCRDGDEGVQADGRSCSFGRPLVIYADRFYAVPTGVIHETPGSLETDAGYRSALASCTA